MEGVSGKGPLLGCIGTVIAAVIAGVFQLMSSIATTNNATERQSPPATPLVDTSASSTQTLDALREAAEERARREVAEREASKMKMALRQRDHDAVLASLLPSFYVNGAPQFDRLRIQNDCAEQIDVAVRYTGLDKKAVTEGWWTVAPHSSTLLSLKSTGDSFFIYGKAASFEWNGTNKSDAVSGYVTSEAFLDTDDGVLEGTNKRVVSFFKVPIGPGWDERLQRLTCD
jgi:uncharacterized membrane protein